MLFITTDEGTGKWYEGILHVLYKENYKRVYKTALSFALDVELAKDITQEAFYRAFLRIHTLRDKDKFGSWVCSIALNVGKDMLKERITYRNNNISLDEENENLQERMAKLVDLNIPDEIYEKNEVRRELQKYISELDEDSQRIIFLKYHQELTYNEIAEKMDMKLSTVKVKMHRAKEKIVIKLEKYFDIKGEGSSG